MLAVCRKTKDGSKFLEYYTCQNISNATKAVEKLNTEKPKTLWNGVKIDWANTEKFFLNEQEGMY